MNQLGEIGNPIAISGVGVITPLGDSLDTLATSLCTGYNGILQTWQSAKDIPKINIASIPNFDPLKYSPVKGLRLLNRTTQLGLCAAKLALDDAKIYCDINKQNNENHQTFDDVSDTYFDCNQIGLIGAFSFAHLPTLIKYDRSVVVEGLHKSNPALVPFSIPSAASSQIALSLGLKALCFTISSGNTSSLEALNLATLLLQQKRARALVVVTSFSFCDELLFSMSRASKFDTNYLPRPFDTNRKNIALGEAAAAVVLEPLSYAQQRDITPLTNLSGLSSAMAADNDEATETLLNSCTHAIKQAGIDVNDIGVISASASGDIEIDRREADVISCLYTNNDNICPIITAIKGSIGETLETGGLLQTLVAAWSIRNSSVPAIANLVNPETPLNYAQTKKVSVNTKHALITSTSHAGNAAALVISNF
ncbi:MAG: hypothetical protein JW841_07090 [Deltaproteobacteria bacterium]|nr:hypothetical protein [Deltaproteobacteria bacterium]